MRIIKAAKKPRNNLKKEARQGNPELSLQSGVSAKLSLPNGANELLIPGYNNVDLIAANDVGIPVFRVPAYSPWQSPNTPVLLILYRASRQCPRQPRGFFRPLAIWPWLMTSQSLLG
jgi:hypothetical protein